MLGGQKLGRAYFGRPKVGSGASMSGRTFGQPSWANASCGGRLLRRVARKGKNYPLWAGALLGAPSTLGRRPPWASLPLLASAHLRRSPFAVHLGTPSPLRRSLTFPPPKLVHPNLPLPKSCLLRNSRRRPHSLFALLRPQIPQTLLFALPPYDCLLMPFPSSYGLFRNSIWARVARGNLNGARPMGRAPLLVGLPHGRPKGARPL